MTASATPWSPSQSLIEQLNRDNAETALPKAMQQLEQGAGLPLVMAIVRTFVQIGTPGLAVRLLRSSPQLIENHADIAALVEQLSAMPSGEVPLESLDDRFDANLCALTARFPNLTSDLADHMQTPSDVTAFKTSTGNYHLLRTRGSGSFQLIFPLTDHHGQARDLQLPPLDIGTGFLAAGVPSPPMLHRLMHLEGVNGYCPPIDIVDTSAEIFALWLRLIEDVNDLHDERLAVFIGDDAWAQYEQFMLEHPTRVIASHTLKNLRPTQSPDLPDANLNDRLTEARNERHRRAMRKQNEQYGDMTPKQWAQRFQQAGTDQPPLRIVGFTSRFTTVIQYAMRDLATAFHRRGCTFDVYKEPTQCGEMIDFPGVLADGEYDMIVVINHLRQPNQHRIHPNIPYVCWIQDYMPEIWTTEAGRSIGSLDLVLGHAKAQMCEVYGYPPDRFLPTSNVTDAHTYSAEPVPKKDREPYECDVSFISHGSAPPEVLIQQMTGSNRGLSRMFQRFLECIRAELESGRTVTFMDQLRMMLRAEQESGHPPIEPADRARKVFPAMQRLYDRVFRHQTVAWLAEWAEQRRRNLRLFGRGWDEQPRYAKFAAGEVANGYPLRCAYQASSVSIQANGYGSLHQRLLDGLASGCCMLSRYNPSDWHGVHRDRLRDAIAERNLSSMQALRDAAQRDKTLTAELNAFADTFGCDVTDHASKSMRPLTDMGLLPPRGGDDEMIFDMLRTGGGIIVDRVAGHLDGFDQLTFCDKAQLFTMLDQYVDDPDRRRTAIESPRSCVIEHDTYDRVADAILNHFRTNLTRI